MQRNRREVEERGNKSGGTGRQGKTYQGRQTRARRRGRVTREEGRIKDRWKQHPNPKYMWAVWAIPDEMQSGAEEQRGSKGSAAPKEDKTEGTLKHQQHRIRAQRQRDKETQRQSVRQRTRDRRERRERKQQGRRRVDRSKKKTGKQ